MTPLWMPGPSFTPSEGCRALDWDRNKGERGEQAWSPAHPLAAVGKGLSREPSHLGLIVTGEGFPHGAEV